MRLLLAILVLSSIYTSAAQAQQPWALTKPEEVTQPISKLNPWDRHAILHQLQIAASELRAEAIKFDGRPTFIIQGYGSNLCSGTGNCSFWIFDSKDQMLLKTQAQTYTFLSSTHRGQNDLVLGLHNSAFESAVSLWQFDGARYLRISCSTVTFAGIDGKEYAHPKVEAIHCE